MLDASVTSTTSLSMTAYRGEQCVHCVTFLLCSKGERLDWMYGGGMVAKADAEKRKEDMLMGKTDVTLPQEQAQEVSNVSACMQLDGIVSISTAFNKPGSKIAPRICVRTLV